MSRRATLRRIRRESQQLEKENNALKDYYITLENHVERTRRIHHDIRKHMDVLHTIIDKLELNEDATSCLVDLDDAFHSLIPINYIDHTVVNAIILNKMKVCNDLGIQLEVEVHSFANTSMKDSDLVVLFANLLDNAIEECNRLAPSTPKIIHLKCGKKAGNFILVCSNPTCKVSFTSCSNTTEKADAFLHGLGLSILEEMLNDYHGTIHISIQEGVFECTVLLPEEMEAN